MMVPHKIPMPHEYPWSIMDDVSGATWAYGMFKTEAEAQTAADAANATVVTG